MLDTSSPERIRSLPNLDLDLSHKHVRLKPPINLRSVSRFKKQCKRLSQIGAGIFNRDSLAGDVETPGTADG